MGALTIVLWLLLSANLLEASPIINDVFDNKTNYASKASQLVAINILKSFNDIDGNQVYSPLGITTMLAILAEAAGTRAYDEFVTVLHYPSERLSLKDSYKRLLARYQTRVYGLEPSFQTWLYVYRNFTIRDEFKSLLHDYYYVDVKDINREEYDWSEPNTSIELNNFTTPDHDNSKDVVGFETLKHISINDETTMKMYIDNYGEEFIEKETSKLDRIIDDKQYVEKPQLIEALKQQQKEQNITIDNSTLEETSHENKINNKVENYDVNRKPVSIVNAASTISFTSTSGPFKNQSTLKTSETTINTEENETFQTNVKYSEHKDHSSIESVISSKTEEKQIFSEIKVPKEISLPLQKPNTINKASKNSDSITTMSLESHVSTARSALGDRSLFRRDDITSALSANSITGRDAGTKSKMLLFNGLYYRGNWAMPFTFERENDAFFYVTSEDTIKTPMMHTKGMFYMAELQHLKSKVVSLPYQNKKFSIMIVIPDEFDGLHTLVENMKSSDFQIFQNVMKLHNLHIILPKFQIEETSRSESMLKSMGLTKLFSRRDADLSLLSKDTDLHVDEIVQFVNIRVDEGSSSSAALSAVDTESRNTKLNDKYELFEINHPFLYFVMDCEEEFVLVSGKVTVPELQVQLPTNIDIEFTHA